VGLWFVREAFTDEERARLAPHFTNLEGPVFALTNLPEVVKGAMFARYSRTPKSLRRLFLDEFAEPLKAGEVGGTEGVKVDKAEQLFDRVFFEFGDDSVAQLGGVHLACEQASQPLAKAIEWGRLAAYLEQSTRYMRYDDRPGGRWRLTTPPEIEGGPAGEAYEGYATRTFEAYGRMFQPLYDLFAARFPKEVDDSDFLYRSTITAKTCDTLRVLLPAGTRSNLGVFATGQSYEQMLIRMFAHPLAEVREYAGLMLVELRKVIPAFLKRVDLPDRGIAWSRYLAETREATREVTTKFTEGVEPGHRETVTLTDYDPLGEEKVVGAAMYAASGLPDDRLQSLAHTMSADEREAGAARLRGRTRQPAAQAGARVRAHGVPLRRAVRLRRVPRPPAPPPAHPRMATPVARARVRHAGGDRRRGDDRGVGPRDGELGLDVGHRGRARRRGRRPVRGVDGVPHPLRDADERP
jgi:thymidylate synthase ThyX